VSIPKFQVRIPETAWAVDRLTKWFTQVIRQSGTPSSSFLTVSVSYANLARNRSFQITVTGFPIHFDPYPYTGTQRLLNIGVQTVNISWPTTSS
jgi:hypothetical protein